MNWNEKYPATDLINMYGITETTVHATFKKLTRTDIQHNKSNIGKPLATLQAYVTDAYMNLQPVGVPNCISQAKESQEGILTGMN